MRTIFGYVKPYARRMSIGLTIKFVGTMMDLVLPWLLSYMIDTVVPTGSIRNIWLCGGAMVLTAVLCVTMNVTANRMAARVSRQITETLRHDLFSRTAALSFAAADRISVPSLVSRLTGDTYNIHYFFDRMQRMGVRAPLLVFGGMAVSFLIEPSLALVLLCLSPILIAVVWLITKKGLPLYAAVQRRVETLIRTVRENASGVRVIKALSKEPYERGRFADANVGVMDAETRAGSVMAASSPAMSLILNTGLTLVIVVGAFRVNLGLMQPGKILAFLTYFTIILNATLTITKFFMLTSRANASAKRIETVLLAPDELPVVPSARVEEPYHIAVEHLTFSYNGKHNDVNDVSFRLLPGQTLGVIGPTGSGKTTLISLLLRHYDAQSGSIRIRGEAVSSMTAQRLSDMFGVVFQNDVLLGESVFENIAFMRDIPLERVQRAAKIAQADGFIGKLPEGYDCPLNIRGVNLSGGQRQRLLIARALAGDPEILILDDAESALDYATEAALRTAIREAFGRITTIIVSERISAIRHADSILVLDDGKTVGLGTHEQLMETCPVYRDVALVQMGGDAA